MRCLFYFECSFDESLENPMFNTYYGPVIKENDRTVAIANHAENKTVFYHAHFGKIGLGKALFDSPSDLINAKELKPRYETEHHETGYYEDSERRESYALAFFYEDTELVRLLAAKYCKAACMKEYQRLLKEKIKSLTSELEYTDELKERSLIDF